MNIVKHIEHDEFKDLNYGDCFIYKHEMYMKIITLTDTSNSEEYNAVEIRTGNVDYICDYEAIIKIDDAEFHCTTKGIVK